MTSVPPSTAGSEVVGGADRSVAPGVELLQAVASRAIASTAALILFADTIILLVFWKGIYGGACRERVEAS
jgi:hypothetical protein